MPDSGGAGGGKRGGKGSGMNTYVRYLGLAVLLPAGSMVGYGVGYALDVALHTHIFKIVCMLLGTAGGFVAFITELTRK